ncbi:MAG: YceI family protein [Myxococcota bacterium]
MMRRYLQHATLAVAFSSVVLTSITGVASPARYHVDHERSYVLAVVALAGVLRAVTDEHAVIATDGEASVCYDHRSPRSSKLQFRIPVRSLRIDTRQARRLARLDEHGPAEPVRQELQRSMLSPRFLDATRHEDLWFSSTDVDGSGDQLWISGSLTLRGITRQVSFPLDVTERDGQRLFLRGGLLVNQSDFGMEPKDLAGLVRIADAVSIRFEILAQAGGRCDETVAWKAR